MNRRSLLRIVLVLASLAGGLAPGLAWAGRPTDVVREKQTALFSLLAQDSPDQKKIGAIFDEMLDYRGLAEASLGAEWEHLTEAQRAEFTRLLEELVTRAYEKHLKKTLAFRIDYVGEVDEGHGVWLVQTRATHKTDVRVEPVSIGFKLAAREKDELKVIDLVFEEVSLVDSYRAQFTKVIKKEGWAGLLEKMKRKIEEGR